MYFQLGNDIDLNPGYTFNPNDENSYQDAKIWTPIGATSCFKGNFDGNGHTISGLLLVGKNIMRYNDITTIYEGLFGEIEDMTLSDMTIDNSIILYNVDASEIDNITCGFFAADAKNCNLNELVNKGTILLTTTNMNTYVYYQITPVLRL